ncbi:MAG: hypothetical protein NZM33_17375 [Bryobacteraceae bacterium]|nr:hypothetical protein [Bryobacteraceae bacterium]
MTATTHATRRLQPGTLVITADGEPGRIREVCTFRRNGDAYSYVVETAYGREIWHADEVVLPARDDQ